MSSHDRGDITSEVQTWHYADICSYACAMNLGQELEINSVIKDTEQLFNSVNSNTPLCSVKEQLTSFSTPSRHFYSFSPSPPPPLSFFPFILSFLSITLAPTRFVLANEVLTPTREMQYRTCFYSLLYLSFSKLVFLFGPLLVLQNILISKADLNTRYTLLSNCNSCMH